MIRSRALATNRWSVCTPTLTLTLILTLMLVAALAPPARAQITRGVPTNIKTAASIDKDSQAAIQKFVTDTAQQLASEAADASSKARDTLINETRAPDAKGQNTATAAYLDFYAQCANAALTSLATNPNARVRLNAAIVAAGVAREAGPIATSVQLAPLIQTLLQDKSQAVVLWAVKAAGPTIYAQLKPVSVGQPPMQLINAVIAAVKANPKGLIGGAIAYDAYDALAMNVGLNKSLTQAMLKALVAPIQDLITFRLTLYQKGVPAEPRAERIGSNFIANVLVFPLETDAQKLTTMQLLSDLLNLAAAQAQVANPGDSMDLIGTISLAAKSMTVAAQLANAKPAADALQPLIVNNLAQQPKAQLVPQAAAVFTAVKGIPAFSAIKPPPQVKGNEPAPAPASAPTTNSIAIPGTSTLPPPGAAPAAASAAAGDGATTKPATRPGAAAAHPTPPASATPANHPPGAATPAGGAGGTPRPATPPAAGGTTPNTPKR